MDLELLKRFYAAAQEGQIGRAAQRIYVAQSALTRSIQLFEHQMKNKLFTRSTKGAQLTPQGERLYEFAKKIMDQTTTFEKIFHEKDDDISGDIKIIVTPFVGSEWLVPNLKGFLKKHPDIKVKVLLTSDNLNVSEGDVILSSHIFSRAPIIQKHLLPVRIRLFASSDYLEEYGIPKTAKDLDHHRLITYKGNYSTVYGSTDWVVNLDNDTEKGPRESYFEINSLYGMLKSALNGYGIVELPDYTCVLESGLKEVLPHINGRDMPLYYSFLKARAHSKKINLLFDYLSKEGK